MFRTVAVGLAAAFASAAAAQTNPLGLTAHHATLNVADLDKESAWYEQVLGFQLFFSAGGGDGRVVEVGVPGYAIDLVQQKGSVRPGVANGAAQEGWLHLAFLGAVEPAYARLKAAGADVVAMRDAKGAIGRLTFHDPEGNELEIFRPETGPPGPRKP